MKYREGHDIDYIRLMELLDEAGRGNEAREYKKLVQMVEDADIVVTAWDFDYMIGFAQFSRSSGRIYNVLVDRDYLGKGIDKGLVDYILKKNRNHSPIHIDDETLTYLLNSSVLL